MRLDPYWAARTDLKRKKAETSTTDLDPCYVEDEMGQICG